MTLRARLRREPTRAVLLLAAALLVGGAAWVEGVQVAWWAWSTVAVLLAIMPRVPRGLRLAGSAVLVFAGWWIAFRYPVVTPLPSLHPVRPFGIDVLRHVPVLAWTGISLVIPMAWSDGRRPRRAGLLLTGGALLAAAAWLLTPQHFNAERVQVVREADANTVIVRQGEVHPCRWHRTVVRGIPLLRLPQVVYDEWVVADLAQGVHARTAVPSSPDGSGGGTVATRAGVWKVQKAMVLAWVYLHGGGVLLLPLLWGGSRRSRFHGSGRRAATGLALVLAFGSGAANLLLLALGAGVGLSEVHETGGRLLAWSAWLVLLGGLSWAISRELHAHLSRRESAGGGSSRRPLRNASLLGAAGPRGSLWMGAFALVACTSREPREPAEPPSEPPAEATEVERPDLVVLLAPGLRADPPGGEAAVSAMLEGFPGEPNRRYRAAYAQSVSAHASFGSLVTGAYPSTLPLCHPAGSGTGGTDLPWCARLPEDRRTLPELCGIYGYRTALFAGEALSLEGVDRGFQHREALEAGPRDPDAWAAASGRVSVWWDRHAQHPRLVFVVIDDLLLPHNDRLRERMGIPRNRATAEGIDTEGAERAYGEAAARAGRGLGALVQALAPAEDRPRWVVVSSLHGVSLVKRTGFGTEGVRPLTSGMVLDRTARVPLALFGPPSAGGTVTVDEPVELLDLHATLLARADIPVPARSAGHDLLARSPAGETGPDPWAYVEFGDMLALRQGRYLLVFRAFMHDGSALDPALDERLREAARQGAHTSLTLHDVRSDPWQEDDLCSRERERCLGMLQRLGEVRRGPAALRREAITPERLWELRMNPAQGYW